MPLLYKNFAAEDFLARYDLLDGRKRILNAGSSSVRYGSNCVNVDIQRKPNVDVVCDIQELPGSLGTFDAVVCNAALQYCSDPQRVAESFHRVLVPGGLAFIDAPWVQPYFEDKPDLLRFSEDALRSIFGIFEILELGVSIRPGSAMALLGQQIAGRLTTNKYVNFALRHVAGVLLFPLRSIRTVDDTKTAGALYVICRKAE